MVIVTLELDSNSGWQTLGELQLTIGPDATHTVHKWLAVILSQLGLHADFLSVVLKSAQEVTSRAMQEEAVRNFQHLHLLIFVPSYWASNGRTWGFFRIDKVENASEQDFPDHAIEFYLYQERR